MAYAIGDPNHIDVHNALVADVQAAASRAGVTVVLPDPAALGDLGHTSDHNLIVDALAAIAAAPPPGVGPAVATGGTVTEYTGDGTNGVLGKQYRLHRFNANGVLTVTGAGVVSMLIVAGGGGAGSQAAAEQTGCGGAGGYIFADGSIFLPAGDFNITVGAGGALNANGGVSGITGPGGLALAATGGGRGGVNRSNPGEWGGSGGGGGDNGGPGGAAVPGQGFAGGTAGGYGQGASGGGAGGPGSWNGDVGTLGGVGGTVMGIPFSRGGNSVLGNPGAPIPNTGNGGDNSGSMYYAGASGFLAIRCEIV